MTNYEDYYEELRNYLKSPMEDEANIKSMLERAHAWVQGRCGDFGLDNARGKDLVFNRVRFDYAGQVDLFGDLFMDDLSSLSFELLRSGEYAEEAE